MKKFVTGFLTGTVATVATVAGVALAVKKAVIDPIDEQEALIDEKRKRALRKSRAR